MGVELLFNFRQVGVRLSRERDHTFYKDLVCDKASVNDKMAKGASGVREVD